MVFWEQPDEGLLEMYRMRGRGVPSGHIKYKSKVSVWRGWRQSEQIRSIRGMTS